MKRLTFLLFPLTILSENIQFYEGPSDKSDETFQSWWQTFQQVRDEAYKNLDLSIYDVEEIKWARTSFIQPQVMVHERSHIYSHIFIDISENCMYLGLCMIERPAPGLLINTWKM